MTHAYRKEGRFNIEEKGWRERRNKVEGKVREGGREGKEEEKRPEGMKAALSTYIYIHTER